MPLKSTLAVPLLATLSLAMMSQGAHAAQRTQGFGLALRSAGTYNNLPAQGAEISVRFGKIEVSAGAMTGKTDWTDATNDNETDVTGATSAVTIEDAMLTQQSVNATLKLHPMNGSFYFGLGAGASRLNGKLAAQGASGGRVDEEITIDRQLGTLSVGNVWTPGGVMIGAEWVGLSTALGSKTKVESKSTSDDTAEARDFFAKDAKFVGEGGAVNMLVLHLGYMIGK